MNIAQIAPVWERVPPVKYGGIELVVYLLTEELVRRGHKVTLFGTKSAKTSAEKQFVYYSAQREIIGNPIPDLLHVSNAFEQAEKFDILHNHCGYSGVTLAKYIDTPVLTTLHGIFTNINKRFFRFNKNSCYYNSISMAQRKSGPKLNYIGNVYNAIDIDSYHFQEEKDDYFIFISRMSPLKGPDKAIQIAFKAGIKLKIAGKIDAGADTEYFEEKVNPLVDDEQIIYMGEVTEKKKRQLLKGAKGFLFPLQWPEPFGLVMVEAMACGTPVIAYPYGSVSEVVVDKKTGFIVETDEDMVKAIKLIDQISPEYCRKYVEKQFSSNRMTNDYESLYNRILKKEENKYGH